MAGGSIDLERSNLSDIYVNRKIRSFPVKRVVGLFGVGTNEVIALVAARFIRIVGFDFNMSVADGTVALIGDSGGDSDVISQVRSIAQNSGVTDRGRRNYGQTDEVAQNVAIVVTGGSVSFEIEFVELPSGAED